MEMLLEVLINKETESYTFKGITLTQEEMQALVNTHAAYQHEKTRPPFDGNIDELGTLHGMR